VTSLKIKLSAKESAIEELKFQNDMLARKNNLLKMRLGRSLGEEEEKGLEAREGEASQETAGDCELENLIADLKVLSQKRAF